MLKHGLLFPAKHGTDANQEDGREYGVGEARMGKSRNYLVLLPKSCCIMQPHLSGKTLSTAAYLICFKKFSSKTVHTLTVAKWQLVNQT